MIKVTVQFLSVVILARLLSPDDFGLFAMVMPLTAFVMMFQDMGLAQAVVTSKTITQRQASTLFWVNMALSCVLAAAFAASAPLIAAFYAEPRVTPLIWGLACVVVISGLGAQHLALLNRNMRFGRLAMIDIVAVISGFAAAAIIALWRPGPWALAASVAVTMSLGMAGAWLSSGWRPGAGAPVRDVADMLRLGGGLTGFNLTNFIARNADNVMIGRAAGPLELGLYDRAYKLLLLPLQQINAPISRVMVPVLSRMRDEPERYLAAYSRTVRQILLVALPGVVFLILSAQRLIPFLMGDEWAAAAPIFAWLGVAALHQPLTSTVGWLFISQHRTGEFAKWGLFSAVTCLAAFAAGLPWGALGVAMAYALSDIFVRMPAVWWWVGRRGPVRTGHLYALATPFALSSAVCALCLWLARDLRTAWTVLDLTALAALSYGSAWAALAILPEGRKTLADAISLMQQALAKLRRKETKREGASA